jgi:sec-independent protein translocase protein TatC
MGSSSSLPIQLEAKVNEYLSLIMRLIFAFGISFQLPILLKFISKNWCC